MDIDEHPKPDSSVEKLSKLPPVFKKNGVVSAGNASVFIIHQVTCDHDITVV